MCKVNDFSKAVNLPSSKTVSSPSPQSSLSLSHLLRSPSHITASSIFIETSALPFLHQQNFTYVSTDDSDLESDSLKRPLTGPTLDESLLHFNELDPSLKTSDIYLSSTDSNLPLSPAPSPTQVAWLYVEMMWRTVPSLTHFLL
ncbi:unnamed protein product [Vicia faba]|uniref:Uncharacterized protein n=1 Tax=Vicia faba TaxID=3906 RepID=A0AAV1AHW3_VICFA|nr:unnamed protein product [Vicia faba]